MLRRLFILLPLLLLLPAAPLWAEKIGTMTEIVGAEDLHIEGYGIVIGLKGTGDKSPGVIKLMQEYMEKNNISLALTDLDSKNIAFVKVDSEIPAFSQPGEKVDVRVAALDAASLEGGILQQCFLRSRPGGPVLATATGRVQVGPGATHPTTGVIPANRLGGAQIMAVLPTRVVEDDYKFRLNLSRKSHADAAAIARAINESDSLNPYKTQVLGFGDGGETRAIAWALDAGQVIVQIPPQRREEQTRFIAEVKRLDVAVETPARVLFNRQTKTVIVTGEVRVDPVAISQGSRFVTLQAPEQLLGSAQATGNLEYRLGNNDQRSLVELNGYRRSIPNLRDMIHTLNAMGTSSEDIATILQKMKAAGALHAELIVE